MKNDTLPQLHLELASDNKAALSPIAIFARIAPIARRSRSQAGPAIARVSVWLDGSTVKRYRRKFALFPGSRMDKKYKLTK